MRENLLYSVSSLIRNVGHRTLTACGAVRRRRRPVERGDRGHALVDGSTLLLRGHAWVVRCHLGLACCLGLHVAALVLLGRRRSSVRRLLLGLRIHLVLLELGLVRVLVDRRLLALVDVRRLGILIHWDFTAR